MERLIGFRPSRWSYNSSLMKEDDTEICSVDLKRWTEQGTLKVTDFEKDFELVHKIGSGVWTLNNGDGVAVCVARKPKAMRTKVILEEVDTNGVVQKRLRIQTKKMGFQSMYVYEVGTEKTEDEAFDDVEGEESVMTFNSKMLKKDWEIEKNQDLKISNVFLSFVYIMFVIFYRRRSQEAGAAGAGAGAGAF